MIAAAVQWAKRIMRKIIWGRLTRATALHCATWNSNDLGRISSIPHKRRAACGLSSDKFEEFAGLLLERFGFLNVEVTGRSGDGGIDGRGELKLGLAVVRAGFQCKRWQAQVGSPEVQAFRGAIQGQCELGYFFATSPAQAESVRKGAVPIILFDGDQIGEIMIEKEVGVRRRPVELYEDQTEGLFESS